VTDRRATTLRASSDRWANLEALGAAAGRKPPRPPKMSSRRRRNPLRTLAIVLVLVVVLAEAGAISAYRDADRLVGKGRRPVAGRRTDTIIVLHVSPDRDKAVMVSLPRDLRAGVNGRTNKLNAAFALGGPDLLVKTVERTTGLTSTTTPRSTSPASSTWSTPSAGSPSATAAATASTTPTPTCTWTPAAST
jgi:LytR_cpsA_psr family